MRAVLLEHRLLLRKHPHLSLHHIHPSIFTRNVSFTNTSPVPHPLRELTSLTSKHSPLVFHSQSKNPYINLSIEHYLLTKSSPNSVILFFYVNRPSVIIGRNQNPWIECNLRWIQEGLPPLFQGWHGTSIPPHVPRIPVLGQRNDNVAVELVRRRSGGGTVFHDMGNLNYTVIVPNDRLFTRAKYAEMVVRALTGMSKNPRSNFRLPEVRVNERNDIVMKGHNGMELKVSGTAYKITRGRALHHGTLLFSSGNLSKISGMLRNPYRPFFEAKGVESVRSPVANLSQQSDPKIKNKLRREITKAIVQEFWEMYGPEEESKAADTLGQMVKLPMRELVQCQVDDGDAREQENAEIFEGVKELMSQEWRFGQTPRFSYRTGAHLDQEVAIEAKGGKAEVITFTKGGRVKKLDLKAGGITLSEIENWKATLDPMLKTKLHGDIAVRLAKGFPLYTSAPNPKAKDKDKQDPQAQSEKDKEAARVQKDKDKSSAQIQSEPDDS